MNKSTKLFLVATMLLLCVGIASAALSLTLTSPATSATMRNGSTFTVTTNTIGINDSNCSFFVWSSDTANTSESKAFRSVYTRNLTNQSIINVTLWFNHPNELEDASTYSAKVTCTTINGTEELETATSSTNTGITFDHTAPATPTTSSITTNNRIKTTTALSYAVTGGYTTACTLFIGGANMPTSAYTSFAMVHSGDTCTYSINKSTMPDATYNVFCRATDGLNTTDSATVEGITFDSDGTRGGNVNNQEIGAQVGVTQSTQIGIGVAVILAAIFFLNNKKGKR